MTADPASRLPEPPIGRTDWRLARALSEPTLRHDRALATISHAFGGACATGLLERIDDAVRPMFGVAGQALPICFGELPDGLDVSALRSCCAHELAFTILAVIGGHAPAAQAGAADRVRAAMPIDWDLTGWSPPAGL